MKLVLNIGMHKTGSSSIQQTLKKYNRKSCTYLDVGHPNHSGLLMTMFMEKPELYHSHRKNSRNREAVERLKAGYQKRFLDFCDKNVGKTIISSAEDVGLLSIDELVKMKLWLDNIFSDYSIIGYARPPVSLMSSAFQQRVAGGGQLRPASLYPNYQKRLEKFDEVFGQEKVSVIRFDREYLLNGDVVEDFCQRGGISIEGVNIVRDNSGRSLEATAVAFVQRTLGNGYQNYPGSAMDNYRLIELLQQLGTTKVQLSREILEPVLEDKVTDLKWISKRTGTDFCNLEYNDGPAISSYDDLNDIAAKLLPDLARILAEESKGVLTSDPELIANITALIQCRIRKRREGQA